MSYVLSDIEGLCPDGTPRVGWVSYLCTLDTGQYAFTGVWIQGDYSCYPPINADGSSRGLDGSGVYSGWGTLDTAPYDPSVWVDFDPTLVGDSAALAEIAGTATDSAVTAAVTAALSGQPYTPYATAIDTPATTSYVLLHPGDSAGETVTLSEPNGSPTPIYFDFTWVSSDPTVATVVGSGTQNTAFTVTEVAPGSCTVTGTSGSPAAPTLAVTVGVTCT